MIVCALMSEPIESTEFSVRPATDEDLSRVSEIERFAYLAPCLPWSEAAFRAEIAKDFSHFHVLTDDETDSVIIGYIVYWLLHDECHILNVAIDPEWRGLGFAVRLVRTAINAAVKREFQRVFLEVRKSNVAAVALYQKLGFFIDHIKPHFYENGEDAYFMVLNLKQVNKI